MEGQKHKNITFKVHLLFQKSAYSQGKLFSVKFSKKSLIIFVGTIQSNYKQE